MKTLLDDLIQELNMDMIFYFKDRENLSIFMTHSDFMENIFDCMSEEEKNEYCFNTNNFYRESLCHFGNETNLPGTDVGGTCVGDSGGPTIIKEDKK